MKCLFLVFGVFLISNFFAQDEITLKNGEEVEVKLIRITDSKIIYKNYTYLDGPEYEVLKRNVLKVTYENGEIDDFSYEALPFEIRKNVLSFNYADFIVNRVSVSYERILKNENISLKIPIGVSIDQKISNYRRYTNYSGLDINIYPLGHRPLSFYTGLSTRFGTITYQRGYSTGPSYLDYNYVYVQILAMGFYVNNGITVNIIENMSISGMIAFGVQDVEGGRSGEFHTVGDLNVSFRF